VPVRPPPVPGSKFQAKRAVSSRLEFFERSRLQGATVDGASQVILSDETRLRAVEVVRAITTVEHSELDYIIARALVQYHKAEQ